MKIHVARILPESVVDGPGMRITIFFQGCSHHCPGCHNPDLQSFEGGEEYTPFDLFRKVKPMINPLIKGITLSGGDPLYQWSRVALFAEMFKDVFPEMDIWLYTGFTWDTVSKISSLYNIDVVVDGPYIEAEKDLNLAYRGSRNQRLIDVRKSLKAGKVVEVEVTSSAIIPKSSTI